MNFFVYTFSESFKFLYIGLIKVVEFSPCPKVFLLGAEAIFEFSLVDPRQDGHIRTLAQWHVRTTLPQTKKHLLHEHGEYVRSIISIRGHSCAADSPYMRLLCSLLLEPAGVWFVPRSVSSEVCPAPIRQTHCSKPWKLVGT